jgi:hypothetical protein
VTVVSRFVFRPPLYLPNGTTVRTIDHALLFAQNYLGAKWPRRQRRIIAQLLSAITPASERGAANDFLGWVEAERILDRKRGAAPPRRDHRMREPAETPT